MRLAVMRLAARYLLRERRRGAALDPVANFHLRNGARNRKGFKKRLPAAACSLRHADGCDSRASAVVLVKGALHCALGKNKWPWRPSEQLDAVGAPCPSGHLRRMGWKVICSDLRQCLWQGNSMRQECHMCGFVSQERRLRG